MNRGLQIGLFATLVLSFGCNDIKSSPKAIDADGTIYLACTGLVRISGSLQQGYEVSFTDASGLEHDVRGIRKLEISDLPTKTACGNEEHPSSDAAAHDGSEKKKDGVSEACEQARANGTSMKWNEDKKRWDVNPVCQ
jgi:hypothetical protein